MQPYYPNQTYTFYTTSDDGVRLWVNGQLLIDKWVPQGATEWSGSIALGSSPVDLILEYFGSPYTKSWTPPAAGVYNLSARVYYNTTHTLNTPVNKLTVSAPALNATTINTGSGHWDSASTTLSYKGGAGSQFVLLKPANTAAPLSSWTRVATTTVTPGSFTIPPVGTAAPAFYRIKSE